MGLRSTPIDVSLSRRQHYGAQAEEAPTPSSLQVWRGMSDDSLDSTTDGSGGNSVKETPQQAPWKD